MELTTLKQLFIGAAVALISVIGVKVSDIKLIEYRIEKVEQKVDKIIEHLGVQ